MDVQGSQFHLLFGDADWGRCTDTKTGQPLGLVWAEEAAGLPSALRSPLEFDAGTNALRLRRDAALFRRVGRTLPMVDAQRRGAGRDAYGNWYWIGPDEASIRWRPNDDGVASDWWAAQVPAPSCADDAGAGFATCRPPAPTGLTLRGLTVTSRHYLLAGYTAPTTGTARAETGLLVFDLQAGGEPLRMAWPADVAFAPWDLSDTPDGGALVLDQVNATYWRLDPYLRVTGRRLTAPARFQPAQGSVVEERDEGTHPIGTPLAAPSLRMPMHAVGIEPGPGNGVLILDSDPLRGYSLVHLFDGDQLVWTVSLADSVEVIDPRDPTDAPQIYSLLGHDFVYGPGPITDTDSHGNVVRPGLLYVADVDGKQVVAYELVTTGVEPVAEHTVVARPDFLPLRRWGGEALVRAGTDVWYDFTDRWIPIEVFTECRFQSAGTFTTAVGSAWLRGPDPSGFGAVAMPAGAPFDSQIPGCVWHRLFLDAQVPNGTAVAVRARANDDPDLLAQSRWLAQPTPYQRSGGAELAWSDPWADRRVDGGTLPDGAGTWELLFQQVIGRYVEIEVTLIGNGRSTPLLRSLRAWYPRFSYADHYLPAIYPASDSPERFFDRFLANFEGLYTALEERIEHTHLILDARTTLAEDLPWLACWFGLALDPLWDEAKRRFLIRHVDRFYRMRGTVAGLVATLRVYLGADPDESVFCTGDGSGDAGGVRVVERFLTRDAGGLAYGDPSVTAETSPDEYTRVARSAHRFDVLVPLELDDDGLAMVTRIVSSAKPAHTLFSVRRYYDLFIVGQARLGIDTELGWSASFRATVLGRDHLAGSYLGYPRPFDIADRIVSDRDRIGVLPAL